jgi:hypothetical protein
VAITLAVGTTVAIASTIAAAKTMSAISNAAEAVATLEASHGIVQGDLFVVYSGWDRLNGRVVRAKAVATNDVTLEGVDTQDTTLYPAGSGTGTVREVTAWTNISQITAGISVAGGEQNFADVTTIVDAIQKQIPTTRSPIQVTLPVFDDPALAWYSVVRTASETSAATPMRMVFPNGSRLLALAYWSLQQVPTIEDSTLRASIDLSFASSPTRYAT